MNGGCVNIRRKVALMRSSLRWFSWLPLLFLCGCQAASLQQIGTSGATEWTGPITESTVWSNNVLVRGQTVVLPGRTLTIQPGSVVIFQQDARGRPGMLVVRGTLYAEGGEREDEHIILAAADQLPDNWAGIQFASEASASRLSYCRILHAMTGIHTQSSDISVDYTLITGCQEAAIVCDNASIRIEYSQLQKNKVGVVCRGNASSIIIHNDIATNDRGISCRDDARPEITLNTIQGNLEEGIWISPPALPLIEQNDIKRNGGWGVYGGGRLLGNFLQGNNDTDPLEIDGGTSRSGNQYYDAEEVKSPRQSPVLDAGPYRRR